MKHVQVRLSDEEYARLIVAMQEYGVESVQDTLIEAIKYWTRRKETNSLSTLNKLEERRLGTLLQYMREQPDGCIPPAIDEKGKTWKTKWT
jgi:hypothetical protein